MKTETPTLTLEVTAIDRLIYAHVDGSWLKVYRSCLVQDKDEEFRPVRELVGDAEPVLRDRVMDPEMIFGRAEMLLYNLGSDEGVRQEAP